jgi:hypothetical protein
MPVQAVSPEPAKRDVGLHHVEDELQLRLKDPVFFRNPGLFTAVGMRRPGYWKKKSLVDQRAMGLQHQTDIDADPTILSFSSDTCILSLDTDGMLAFLDVRRPVDERPDILASIVDLLGVKIGRIQCDLTVEVIG